MSIKGILRTLTLPIVFAFFTAGYFAPFYTAITPGDTSGRLFAVIGIGFIGLLLTLWLYTLVILIWSIVKKTLTVQVVIHCVLIWLVYLVWIYFAANGYMLTV